MVNHFLEMRFPGLRACAYKITSPATPSYNCVAWAANQTDAWWWPDPMGQASWPPGIPRLETIEAFVQAFDALGYAPCQTPDLEPGFEKVALYVNTERKPTHVARQLPNGEWTSKLGKLEDIEHENLNGLRGSSYGSEFFFLKRPIMNQAQ